MIVEAFCLETREIVPIGNYDAEKHKTLVCKFDHKLIIKQGNIVKHHYAHYSGTKCSSHEKTKWHVQWQSIDPKNTEIFMSNDREIHFADIVTDKEIVIEIQHSPISQEEVSKREKFYKDMIWIFDVNNLYTNTTFICKNNNNQCIIKIEKSYLLNSNSETYYDCGSYLLKKIENLGKGELNKGESGRGESGRGESGRGESGRGKLKKYVLCEIVEYSDFIKYHFPTSDVIFPKDENFDFAFTVPDLSITYNGNNIQKIHFQSSSDDINYEPFQLSKYIEGRYFLPF